MEEEIKCSTCSAEPVNSINVRRAIEKLDELYSRNDLTAAGETLAFWANEARGLNDSCGLLSILNETLGYCRRVNDRERALSTADEIIGLIKERKGQALSVATILINLATTLKHFGEAERGLPFFETAEKTYEKYCLDESYEYAALLNNRAASYIDLERLDEAEEDYLKAFDILNKLQQPLEIAETYANLAEIVARKDLNAADDYLDKCWETLTAENLIHDGNYAFTLTKCAPAFSHLGREDEGEVLKAVAKEIYDERN